MTWSPLDGFRINAFLDKDFATANPFATLGKVVIETREDTYALKLWVHGLGRAIAPIVFPMAQKPFVAKGHFSLETSRVIFFGHSPWMGERKAWSGSAIFLTKKKIEFPDSLEIETKIEGRKVEWQNKGGLNHEEANDCIIVGRHLTESSFELSWSLSKAKWAKTDAWNFREASRRALSIVSDQMLWIARASITRNRGEIVELRTSEKVDALKYYNRLFVERDPRVEWQFNKTTFVHLTKFFLSKDPNREVCWSIFRQVVGSAQQETWEARELLVGTVLEAALRTIDNHPFKNGDYTWKVRQSLDSFRQKYWDSKWVTACDRALTVRDRLRHRNAHPDWITRPGGVMSKEEQSKSIEDLTFLSQFYGYMILALAGVKDLEPVFTVVQFH